MLETLRIQNYAIIEEIEADFRAGFNVLTGETGAGKSIVVGALNLVLGGRPSGEVIRRGASQARIEAVFYLPKPGPRIKKLLAEVDVNLEDQRLLLCRAISSDGRTRGYAGGRMVPISVLAAIGDELVDLHGQHEHQSLLKSDRQLDLLDAFADSLDLAESVAGLVKDLHGLDREIEAIEHDDRDRTRQLEFLRFELEEITAADPQPGETEGLKARHALSANAETVSALANQAYALLYENESGAAVDAIDTAMRDLAELGRISDEFRPMADQLSEARAIIEGVATDLRGFSQTVEFDPEELERLNARLALLGALRRKYGATIEDVLAYRDKIASELAAFENRDEHLDALRKKREKSHESALAEARKLSAKRAKAAKSLDGRIASALQDLGMKGAKFETRLEPGGLSLHGLEQVEFLLAANKGENLKPLRQVASGGEISRIMLALKSVFAAADKIPTLIFDEIDAGVGGAVATMVAEKLCALAASHQVLCVTHLAQIAACAGTHFSVAKKSAKNRTLTEVAAIENEDRVEEVARLLDGSTSELSLEHARTLLERSRPKPGRREAAS